MKKLFFLLGASLMVAGITSVQAQTTTSPTKPTSTPTTQQPATTSPSQAMPATTAPGTNYPSNSAPSTTMPGTTAPVSTNDLNGSGTIGGSQTVNPGATPATDPSKTVGTENYKTMNSGDKPKKTKKSKTTMSTPAAADQLTSPTVSPATK